MPPNILSSIHTIPLSKLFCNRPERQRKALDPTGIASLATSISQLGILNPLIVLPHLDGRFEIKAGERRFEAAKLASLDSVPCRFLEELPQSTIWLLELEENLRRENLSWQDEAAAIVRYHNICKESDPAWTQAKTAEAISLTPDRVNRSFTIVSMLSDPVVRESGSFNSAYNTCQRKLSRAVEAELDQIDSSEEEEVEVEPLAQLQSDPSLPPEPPRIILSPSDSILCADFHEWAKTYSGPRFNFLHCDFPYGIGWDKAKKQSSTFVAHEGAYEDSPDTFWNLVETLLSNKDRLIAQSAHIMFWFSMKYYDAIKTRFESAGFYVDPFPLIWHRSDNSGILPDPTRGPRRVYETALLMSLGDRKIVRSTSNLFAFPNEKETHQSEKPQPVLERFFSMFIDDSTSLLDPTCGSGTALRAAEKLGARHVLGLEVDPEHVKNAEAALRRSRFR